MLGPHPLPPALRVLQDEKWPPGERLLQLSYYFPAIERSLSYE